MNVNALIHLIRGGERQRQQFGNVSNDGNVYRTLVHERVQYRSNSCDGFRLRVMHGTALSAGYVVAMLCF